MSTQAPRAAQPQHALLRWLAVLPAAILAAWVAHFAGGIVGLAVSRLVPEPASYYVRLLLYYAPQQAAFVIAGALVAPRPLATACVLAGVAIALSLTVHILGQHSVGTTNYLHFAAESAGAIVGVVASAVARSRAAAARITAPG
jgi:hypothetical protein